MGDNKDSPQRAEAITLPRVGVPLVAVALLAFIVFFAGVWIKRDSVDWYDVLSKVAQFILLCSGLASVLLVRRQMVAQQRQNLETREREAKEFHYNRVDAFYRYFGDNSDLPICHRFEAFLKEANLVGHFSGEGMVINDDKVISAIVTNAEWDGATREYLDRHESLAGAVNIGFIDSEVAFCLQATRIIRAEKVMSKVIDHYQKSNKKAYCELQQLAASWRHERQLRDQKQPIGQVVQRFSN